MGHLSFLLGHFEHDDNLHIPKDLSFGVPVPRWYSYLESHGIPQSWLCGLRSSTVCDFLNRCPRVGIFLGFLEDHKGRQPHVKWYTFLHIPVWYPWTAKLEYLQPPAELLQVAATFVVRTPTAILPSALLPSLVSPLRILSSPRGRAALLEGGIIGRIAKEHLGHDRAVHGPSTAVTVHRQGFSFRDSAGITYWDDRLTDDEINNICGLYRCYTGNLFILYFYPSFIETVIGNGWQMSEVSWWPTPTHWNNHKANGYNWGHWTEWDEVWYQERVKNILSGNKAGVPFTQSDWWSKLKEAGPWRKVTKRVEDESKAFF
jgi:hypothetical protein